MAAAAISKEFDEGWMEKGKGCQKATSEKVHIVDKNIARLRESSLRVPASFEKFAQVGHSTKQKKSCDPGLIELTYRLHSGNHKQWRTTGNILEIILYRIINFEPIRTIYTV